MLRMNIDRKFCASLGVFEEGLGKIVAEATDGGSEVIHEEGYKYVRIVLVSKEADGSRKKQIWGFIDKRTGDIYRPASMKAPSLNYSRGNIHDESNGLSTAHWSGPSYIWEINERRKEESAVRQEEAGEGETAQPTMEFPL
jgi:hypothetical protein